MGAVESAAREEVDLNTLDFDSMDYYAIPGISEGATSEEIKGAYRRRALEHHPDKNTDDVAGATKRFAKVNEAYETLKDDIKRSVYNYDRVTQPQRSPPTSAPNKQPADDLPGGPGAWPRTSESQPPTQSWYDWFFGSTSQPNNTYQWRRGSGSQHSQYIYQDYAAQSRGRVPGMSVKDIVQFVESLGELTWHGGDHGDKSPYTIFNEFFKCLAHDETQWSGRNINFYPSFGFQHSMWSRRDFFGKHDDGIHMHEVHNFYGFWTTFKTSKTFEWISRYYYNPGELNSRGIRYVNKENKLFRGCLQEQYNGLIRTLANALLESDPRYQTHLAIRRSKFNEQGQSQTEKEQWGKKQRKKDKKRKHNNKW